MMHITRRVLAGAAAFAAASVAFAGPAAAADWRSEVETVRFGILSGENEKDRVARYTPMQKYLENALDKPVEIFTASSYAGVMQALASDQIEFAFFGSSSYAGAYEEMGDKVIPLLTRMGPDGSKGYYSVLAVRCDSGLKTVEDLKGKTLAFSDPNSTSGYAVPLFNLKKQGIDPDTYFEATPFSGSHEGGIVGVVNGTYDAAVTWWTNENRSNIKRMADKGMIQQSDVCVVWKSPEITNGPFATRSNLSKELVNEMVGAMTMFAALEPESMAETIGENMTFTPVTHQRYQWIVDMREDLRKLRRKRGS